MEAEKNNVIDFPRNVGNENKILVDSSTYSKRDIIYLQNDGSGGGYMSYITREEFNAKTETVDIKLEKLEDKIDNSTKQILIQTKNFILESEKEQRKWFIGTIAVPIILFILSKM